jgi:hypothetical protein
MNTFKRNWKESVVPYFKVPAFTWKTEGDYGKTQNRIVVFQGEI